MAFLATSPFGVRYVALTVSMFAALAVLPLRGTVVVTYLALWRRWRWPALLWADLLGRRSVARLGGELRDRRLRQGPRLSGLAEFASLCSLLIVVCIASVLACALTGAFNLSKRPAPSNKHIEQTCRGLMHAGPEWAFGLSREASLCHHLCRALKSCERRVSAKSVPPGFRALSSSGMAVWRPARRRDPFPLVQPGARLLLGRAWGRRLKWDWNWHASNPTLTTAAVWLLAAAIALVIACNRKPARKWIHVLVAGAILGYVGRRPSRQWRRH